MPSVNEAFALLLTNLEPSRVLQDAVTTHHNAVRSCIENNLPGVRTKLIGSLQRRTRIHPRAEDTFDIDILLILGQFDRWGLDGVAPAAAIERANQILQESPRYQDLEPTVDHPTVVMDYADGIKIEIVPAYVDNIGRDTLGNPTLPLQRGYWIPEKGRWIHADYDHDAAMVTQGNVNINGRLVPTIKMLKAIKRIHFQQMKSFHLEILAAMIVPLILQTFERQAVAPTHAMVLREFFDATKDMLGTQVCFAGSNSPKTCINFLESTTVASKFMAITTAIDEIERMASESEKIEGWRVIFGDVFPAS